MKIVLAVVGALVLLIGLIVGLIFWGTSGLADRGESFVDALAAQRYEDARALGTPAFREDASAEELRAYRDAIGLGAGAKVSWHGREFSGSVGRVHGVLEQPGDEGRPIELVLMKGDDGWRVQSVVTWPRGLLVSGGAGLPDERQLGAMSRQALRALFGAVASSDFKPMHAEISHLWREQITPEGLAEAFGALSVDDTAMIDRATLLFDKPPSMEINGLVLVVSGVGRAEKPLYRFEIKWVQEGLSWRLFGINIRDP